MRTAEHQLEKKETVTKKKDKKTKAVPKSSLEKLHNKFRKEYPNIRVSYSEFLIVSFRW